MTWVAVELSPPIVRLRTSGGGDYDLPVSAVSTDDLAVALPELLAGLGAGAAPGPAPVVVAVPPWWTATRARPVGDALAASWPGRTVQLVPAAVAVLAAPGAPAPCTGTGTRDLLVLDVGAEEVVAALVELSGRCATLTVPGPEPVPRGRPDELLGDVHAAAELALAGRSPDAVVLAGPGVDDAVRDQLADAWAPAPLHLPAEPGAAVLAGAAALARAALTRAAVPPGAPCDR